MRRRADDDPEFDGRAFRRNGNGGPWWAQGWKGILTLGPMVAIVFILLGALLGVIPSPISKLDAHVQDQGESVRLLQIICIRLSGPDSMAQRECLTSYSRRTREGY